jgi:hypothetical protein
MESELEQKLTTLHKAEMIAYVASHPEAFEELIGLALTDKQPYSWRAAWVLWGCMAKNDSRVQKHADKIIEVLGIRKENLQRELLLILQRLELSDNQKGILFDKCISIWKANDKQASVRYNAFRMMTKIAAAVPELRKEVRSYSDKIYMETLSDTTKKCIVKLAATLKD